MLARVAAEQDHAEASFLASTVEPMEPAEVRGTPGLVDAAATVDRLVGSTRNQGDYGRGAADDTMRRMQVGRISLPTFIFCPC